MSCTFPLLVITISIAPVLLILIFPLFINDGICSPEKELKVNIPSLVKSDKDIIRASTTASLPMVVPSEN